MKLGDQAFAACVTGDRLLGGPGVILHQWSPREINIIMSKVRALVQVCLYNRPWTEMGGAGTSFQQPPSEESVASGKFHKPEPVTNIMCEPREFNKTDQ